VLNAALATAECVLPDYSRCCSPKKFTQHRLFAGLVLENFLKADYRGVVAQLTDCRSLLGLCIGYDSGDAVSQEYQTPGKFTGGTIQFVEVAVDKVQYLDREIDMKQASRD
jgi:hypothetical protein